MPKLKFGIGWDEHLSDEGIAYKNAELLSSIKGVNAMVENVYDESGTIFASYGLSAGDSRSFKKAVDQIITFRGDVLGDIFWLTIDGKSIERPDWNFAEKYLGSSAKSNPGARPETHKEIRTREDARQEAMDFQNWASGQSLSYGELMEHQNYFRKLAKRFGLTKEFKENGII